MWPITQMLEWFYDGLMIYCTHRPKTTLYRRGLCWQNNRAASVTFGPSYLCANQPWAAEVVCTIHKHTETCVHKTHLLWFTVNWAPLMVWQGWMISCMWHFSHIISKGVSSFASAVLVHKINLEVHPLWMLQPEGELWILGRVPC